MHEDEFEATVKGYLMAVSDGRPASLDSVVAGARGMIYRGGDPLRVTFRIDEYASRLGLIEEMRKLRRLIGEEWEKID